MKVFIWTSSIAATDTEGEKPFRACVIAKDLPAALRQLDGIPIHPSLREYIRSHKPDVFNAPYAEFAMTVNHKAITLCNAERVSYG